MTSADSQSLTILGMSFPDRAPSHGPNLFYAQRENRLNIESVESAVSSVCEPAMLKHEEEGNEKIRTGI